MSFEYAPASTLSTSINASAPLAPPVPVSSAVPVRITEVATPLSAPVSSSSPPVWRDVLRRDGATPTTTQVFTQPGAPDVGSTVYTPQTGDFSARPRPSEAPRLNPVNQATAPATSPRTATAGAPINPRIPRPSAAGLARGGVSMGVGVAAEVAAQAAFNAAFPGATERARAYEARNADPRSARPTRGETIAAGSALGLGGAGLAGFGAVAATRYLLPDDVDPGNPNGLIGRILGWDEDYPSQTDPDAMGQGPETQPETTESGGSGSRTVRYQVTATGLDQGSNHSTAIRFGYGPVLGMVFSGTNQVGVAFGTSGNVFFGSGAGFTTTANRGTWAITSMIPTDGSTDPDYQPYTPPAYAPNPARLPRTDDGEPPALPEPPLPEPPAPEAWPYTQPQSIPGTAPLAPPLATPANFSPTAPIGEPNPPTNPNAPPGPPDLDPNAPPRATPADLATDPDTPPLPARSDAPGGAFDERTRWSVPLPFVLPVPVPVGAVQPVNTPSWPNLMERQRPNPNVRFVQQPVTQTPTEGPRGTCFYEFQRVARIEQQATEANTQAKNPTSGFTGLYGIGIESRVKIGESFTLLQQVNQFMRKAWEMTRMQKVLDVLTFIGVMHNVGMLSRDVGETFFQLISQGVQAVGIRDEEDNVIDVGQVVGNSVENLLKGILGEDVYNGIGTAWNKANRIISSASAIIWTVRSIADSSLDLMEWIGENTGRIGNALKRWGVVGERSYPWMSESARAQSRFRNRFSKVTDALENTEDRISNMTIATSTVLEIQEESDQAKEDWQNFKESVRNGIPDPWADNNPVKDGYDASKAISDGPDVPPSEAQKG